MSKRTGELSNGMIDKLWSHQVAKHIDCLILSKGLKAATHDCSASALAAMS